MSLSSLLLTTRNSHKHSIFFPLVLMSLTSRGSQASVLLLLNSCHKVMTRLQDHNDTLCLLDIKQSLRQSYCTFLSVSQHPRRQFYLLSFKLKCCKKYLSYSVLNKRDVLLFLSSINSKFVGCRQQFLTKWFRSHTCHLQSPPATSLIT